MKRVILSIGVVLIVVVAQSISAQKIKGSDTMLPLSQKQAEDYMKKHASETVTVTGGGSGVGISSLLEGTTDIAQLSRRIKFDERLKLEAKGHDYKEVIAAYDALAVIVHPSNKVSRLTREQLENIFRGKIKNWKEVGGEDLRIIPYARETSSGTYEFFRESVLKNRNYMSGIMSLPATGAIIQSVGQTRGAIGYVGFPYLNQKVKALHISYDQGESFVEPVAENVDNETYPIFRPLYYYYITSSEPVVKSFIDYILSDAGQKIVLEVGFITVK